MGPPAGGCLPAGSLPPWVQGVFMRDLHTSHQHFPGESAHLRQWGWGLKLLLQAGQGPLHGEGVPVMLQEQMAVPQVSDVPLNQGEEETLA